jgi:hypothetical protein
MSALTCVVDRPDLASVPLSGTDVLGYLHAVCTQHTLGLAPGDATPGAAAVAQGQDRVRLPLAVLDAASCSTPRRRPPGPGRAAGPVRFRYDVRRRPSRYAGAGSRARPGPPSAALGPRPACPVTRTRPRAGIAGPTWLSTAHPVGSDLVGPAAPAAAAELERAGVERAPSRALGAGPGAAACHGPARADRRRAGRGGRPAGSHVHLDKGCYPGQETVARVHNLGQVQRRLAGLGFEPSNGGATACPRPGPTWSPTTAAAPASSAAWSTTPPGPDRPGLCPPGGRGPAAWSGPETGSRRSWTCRSVNRLQSVPLMQGPGGDG